MSKRFTLKIAGASGQGVNVLGEILLKSLKREGYNVFGYREYPSLIKGGHATYQIDISEEYVAAPTFGVDLVVVLNRQATNWHLPELKQNGVVLHDIENPRISKTEHMLMQEKNIKLVYVPSLKLSQSVGGNDITVNIVNVGVLWRILNLPIENVLKVVEETFADKPKFLPLDIACLKVGFDYSKYENPNFRKRLLRPDEISESEKAELHVTNLDSIFALRANPSISKNLLVSGNEAISLGIINAGVRAYFSYPMTPASSILGYLAENQSETGMIVKQAEDEITAAAMVVGAMHMGTRALTGTSGGGFDLMTEHISLAAIIETPFVCILGQRPGPATGMPTWTSQGDLMLSIFSGHGEYPKCVISVKDAEEGFYAIQEAFNIAEKYQIPVIVLTDKYIAEGIFNVAALDQNKIPIERNIIDDPKELGELLGSDRYKLTDSGISKRWIPGSLAADYDANSDEHDESGNVTEESKMSSEMISKRMRKEISLLNELPQPEIFDNGVNSTQAINIIGWGSTFNVVNDVFPYFAEKNIRINYMHIKYLWPLKTESIKSFINENTLLIEGNHNAQLGQLIKMQTGVDIKHKMLKWDGRPFFVDELIQKLNEII